MPKNLFRPGDKVLGKVAGAKGWHPGVVTRFEDFVDHPRLKHQKRLFQRCQADPSFVLVQFFADDDFAFYDTKENHVLHHLDFNSQVAKECKEGEALERARRTPAGQTTTQLNGLIKSSGRRGRLKAFDGSPSSASKRALSPKSSSSSQPPSKRSRFDLVEHDGIFRISDKIYIRRLYESNKKELFVAEQILKSTFRINVTELREFYPRHEIFALWYQDRMTSVTLVSVHPSISVLNIVFFATLGYLSHLHFGTVLDNFVKYYAISRGCRAIVVTALHLSIEFWKKLGYKDFTMSEEFEKAYLSAGAVRLTNTVILRNDPDELQVEASLRKSAFDADCLLVDRAERSARSTIALRVLAKHSTASPLTSSTSNGSAGPSNGASSSSSSNSHPILQSYDVAYSSRFANRQGIVSRGSTASKIQPFVLKRQHSETFIPSASIELRNNRAAKRSALREYRQNLLRQQFFQRRLAPPQSRPAPLPSATTTSSPPPRPASTHSHLTRQNSTLSSASAKPNSPARQISPSKPSSPLKVKVEPKAATATASSLPGGPSPPPAVRANLFGRVTRPSTTPSPTASSAEWVIEKVLSSKIERGKRYFQVHWRDARSNGRRATRQSSSSSSASGSPSAQPPSWVTVDDVSIANRRALEAFMASQSTAAS